jgi:hypothetical protein
MSGQATTLRNAKSVVKAATYRPPKAAIVGTRGAATKIGGTMLL